MVKPAGIISVLAHHFPQYNNDSGSLILGRLQLMSSSSGKHNQPYAQRTRQ